MLDTKEGAKQVYQIAKYRMKQKQDIIGIPALKDREGRLLVTESEKGERWKEYFECLMNEENEREDLDTVECCEGPIQEFSEREVREALNCMKVGKAVGVSGVCVDMLKLIGEGGVLWVRDLLNEILMDEKMPDEWRKSVLVPVYKQKGDVLECASYRGIKLMEHVMKVYERIIDARLREIVNVGEKQYGFMKGKGTIDAIWIVRQLQEKMLEKNKKLYCCFVDLEKAYDRVPREVVFWCLRQRKVPERLVRLVVDMYESAATRVRLDGRTTDEFQVQVGLHQGSALSPFLFVIVMDVLCESIPSNRVWEMLYADDIVLLAENENQLQQRVNAWQNEIERKGLRVNANKTEVMISMRDGSDSVSLCDNNGVLLKGVTSFKYLGSVISVNGGCQEDVRSRVKAAWSKWRDMSGIMCDKQMPVRLKVKVYKTVIRPVLLYGCELWAVRKPEREMIERTEMRMLRWILGIRRIDRVSNKSIREKVGVICVSEKMREYRLRWLGHVERKDVSDPVKDVWITEVRGKRKRGRPRLRWKDVVAEDMNERGLHISDANDRVLWRAGIRAPDPVPGTG